MECCKKYKKENNIINNNNIYNFTIDYNLDIKMDDILNNLKKKY